MEGSGQGLELGDLGRGFAETPPSLEKCLGKGYRSRAGRKCSKSQRLGWRAWATSVRLGFAPPLAPLFRTFVSLKLDGSILLGPYDRPHLV